jgi:hypothetical protein
MNFSIESNTPVVAVTRNAEYLFAAKLPPQWRYWLGTVQISVLSSNLQEMESVAHHITSRATAPPASRTTTSLVMSGQPCPSGPSASGPQGDKRTDHAVIRSLLIRAGSSGLTLTQVVQRARRMGIARNAVVTSLPELRDAQLITYDGDLNDTTEVRLT